MRHQIRAAHGVALSLVFAAVLTACGGSDDPPLVAVAGTDQAVSERALVQLSGAAEDGPNSQPTYAWSVVDAGGLELTLTGVDSANASFTAPAVAVDTTVTLRLTVTQGSSTATDEVAIVIKPVTDSISLAVLGLGDSVLVTNQAAVTIQGVAQSDAPLAKVSYSNAANASSGDASGTTEWSAPITLTTGDNVITFTVTGADGKSLSITKTLTYYANLALTTPLTLGVDVAYVGETAQTIVTLGDSLPGDKALTLLHTDATGVVQADLGAMTDNGDLPDEIEGDGIFTARATFTVTAPGQQCFRAKVAPQSGDAYLSEVRCVQLTPAYSASQIDEAVALADGAQTQFLAARTGGQSAIEAAQTVMTSLQANAAVGAAGTTPDGGIWWISQAGILGAFHPEADGQKAANRPVQGARQRTSLASVQHSARPAPTVPYAANYLNHRGQYKPQAEARRAQAGRAHALAADDNRMGTAAGLLISPYINNPADPDNSFGNNDDYYVPWQTVINGNQCQLYEDKAILNNGTQDVTLEHFKDFSAYGYVHISTHGDNYYNGLFSQWQDVWGTNGWLTGALSQVALYSGVYVPQDADGHYVLGTYEADVQAKRIAIAPGGAMVLLPGFFQRHLSAMPNSLVALSACRSTYNNSLANVFLAKGAASVVGYTDYVSTSYAQNTLNKMLTDLYAGKTIKEAFDGAVAAFGASDADADPAAFTLSGAQDLKLSDGTFSNLDFESGSFAPWVREGDGRILSQLGLTSPTGGSHMGIISTGLGYTTDSGSIAQTGCLPSTAQKLRFSWNYFSEEFLEYCDSIYQDAFLVEMCEMNGPNPGSCQTLLQHKVDDLCGSVTPADISFDQGDVHMTGWQTTEADVSAFAGKKVRMRFFATDVGDSIYDTAILLDDITAVVAGTP